MNKKNCIEIIKLEGNLFNYVRVWVFYIGREWILSALVFQRAKGEEIHGE